ncbi:MAG: serine hydrolase [Rhodoferax sp.]|nr:serine hydrolase [Rhodoferax sp.]
MPNQPSSLPSASPEFLNALDSDPRTMGWMDGAPPPPAKRVRFADGSMMRFPQNRWANSHYRDLVPTKVVARGPNAVHALPRAERQDLDAVRFCPIGLNQTMTWAESLLANYTDGIVVLHRGSIVYERYFGALDADTPHIAFSVTKSFIGTLAACLVHEGALDDTATVAHYVPELADSAFGDATVREVMDMTTGLQYSEVYTDPQAEIWSHARAGGLIPRPPGYQGPESFYEFLQTVEKQGRHGENFAYKTVNTDALGWIIRRVTGLSLAQNLSQRIWSRLGAEHDAYITVDTAGTEFAGGGLNTTLRDLARFGEMMRNGGRAMGQQVVPQAVVDGICKGADPAKFVAAGYHTLPGWSYRSMWWISHNPHGAYMARGIHGQAIYIDPAAEMVIARYGSHHIAGNLGIDPHSLPAYHAMALYLMQTA